MFADMGAIYDDGTRAKTSTAAAVVVCASVLLYKKPYYLLVSPKKMTGEMSCLTPPAYILYHTRSKG